MSKKIKNKVSEAIEIYKAEDLGLAIEAKVEDETIWLSQKHMSELFQKGIPTINEHIKNVYKEAESGEVSSIRKFRIVQKEGKCDVLLSDFIFNDC